MGQVIPWPSPEKRPVRAPRNPGGPMGEILLYLGVRYERHDADRSAPGTDAPQAGATRSERATRRRRRG